MILGIGTDIIENERIRSILDKHGERFLKRIFTEDEIRYASSHSDAVPYYAARFAVKEATIKALNLTSLPHGLTLKDVEVKGQMHGKKGLSLKGAVLKKAESLGVNSFHISLSHSGTISMAVVIFEKV